MIYLSQMLGSHVIDEAGNKIGVISDLAISAGEMFPRVTSVAFKGPDKTPFMLSWRKYVAKFSDDAIVLNTNASGIRFSYLQPDEILLARDLLNKQIIDTQGMKVVRVNDLKLSDSHNALRLLGAEVGARGLLRALSPALETAMVKLSEFIKRPITENLIAWNYVDLVERDLSQIKLSVTHKRLNELHPADVADILETLSASQRSAVFEYLDTDQAAEAISELEDEYQAGVIDELPETRASHLLAEMDPDDAADIIGDLEYDKAERLLRLMGLEDSSTIRSLLGYKENTAGGIMTPEVITVTETMTVRDTIEHFRVVHDDFESTQYLYLIDADNKLRGVVTLRDLLTHHPDEALKEFAFTELFTVGPEDDQEDVAEVIAKYDLLAVPVVDDAGKLLGIVTVDDAMDVMEEEAEEDLRPVIGSRKLLVSVLVALIIALAVAVAFLTPFAMQASWQLAG